MGAVIYSTDNLVFCSIVKDIVDGRGLIYVKKNNQFINAVEGFLVKIEREDGEYEGKPTHKLKFYLRDKDEESTWVLQSSRTSYFSRAVINSLASLQSIGWTRLTPYVSVDKNSGNKFIHGAVRHNLTFCNLSAGDHFKVPKKFSWEQIPEIEKISVRLKTGKIKEDLDSSARDEFFEKLIDLVISRLSNSIPQQIESSESDDSEIKF